MKKAISYLLALLLVSSCFAFQLPDANALGAVWVKEYYTDKFGDKTEQFYITNKSQFKGTYNSDTGSKGKIGADLIFERDGESLFAFITLSIKGKDQVVNTSSAVQSYDIAVKKPDGSEFATSAEMKAGEGRMLIKDALEFMRVMASGDISIYIEQKGKQNSNYLFHTKEGNFEELFAQEIWLPYQEMRYQKAEELLNSKQYDDATEAFKALGEYKDSSARVEEVIEVKHADAYAKAESLLAEKQYDEATEAFKALGEYKDSSARVEEVIEAKHADAYAKAESLLAEKQYDEATEAFKALGEYKDSSARVEEVIEAKHADAYSSAELMLQNREYDNAIAAFEALGAYSDSAQRVKETIEAKQADAYAQAEELLEQKKFNEAAKAFDALGEYRDSASRIEEVKEAKQADAYAQAEALLEQHKFDEAIIAFQKLGDYKDSSNRIDEIKLEKKEFIYQEADSLYNAGDYDSAYSKFLLLTGFKDVDERLETDTNLLDAAKVAAREAALKSFKTIGKIVQFGSYEQNNDLSNGKEKIEWIVLDTEDNRSLLLSRYGLDAMQYNTSRTDVTWETCSLRKWLNGSFISSAFNHDENKAILTSNVDNGDNNQTSDRLFLLSGTEVREYLDYNNEKCTPTDYAEKQGRDKGMRFDGRYGDWWLRSQDKSYKRLAQAVNTVGSIKNCDVYYEYYSVRPAFWIDLDSDYFWSLK